MPLESIPGWLIITHIPYLVTIVFLVLFMRSLRQSVDRLARTLPRALKRSSRAP